MTLQLTAAALAVTLFALQAHGAGDAPKAANPLGKFLGTAQTRKASSVPQAAPKPAEAPLPSFVIPRDTCQQGEPLQTLPLAKP